jgi:hypothetical protein
MKTLELTITGIFIVLGLILVAATIRYPRTVFVDIPLGIIRMPFYLIRDSFFVRLLLGMIGAVIGEDVNNEYRTHGKRFLDFRRCAKFLITGGAGEFTRLKVIEAIKSTEERMPIDTFRFFSSEEQTVTIPPEKITFYDFNYLVLALTEGHVYTVGLVQGDRITFTVFDDPETGNLIGEADRGEKFFISMLDNFHKKQFLRLTDQVEISQEKGIKHIVKELNAVKDEVNLRIAFPN